MRLFFRSIKRFFYWGWKLRNNHDWDGTSLYEVMELKLLRMRQACYQDGHHVWSEKSREYKAISECIYLCRSLREEKNPYWDMFHKEFGEFDYRIGDDRRVDFRSKFHQKQLSVLFKKGEELQKQRRERLFGLLAKWLPYFWD